MLNKNLQANVRRQSLDEAWARSQTGTIAAKTMREALKDLIWKGSAPDKLRARALELLLTQTAPEDVADTQNLIRLRLPTEGNWLMVVEMCKAIADRASEPGWSVTTGALVRSYARKVPAPPDADRPERGALLALHPGLSIERVVFEAYLKPDAAGATSKVLDDATKTREGAWDLLARLDPDGSQRTAMIAAEAPGDPALTGIARAARELGVVPVTGSELAWLNTLLNESDTPNKAWWSATAAGVATLSPEQRAGLGMRHLEAVRWGAAHHRDWLSASREQLLSELTQRLESRRSWRSTQRGSDDGLLPKELLRDWQSTLTYPDLLTILVIDEAIHAPGISADLFKQAEADRADATSEYGGAIFARDANSLEITSGGPDGFTARPYTPRPAQRINDRTYVSPSEMFAQSGRALAHYHLHVQSPRNADYAAPGRGDLEYASTHGRACIVFTSVRADVLNADYYARGGVSVDLGEITPGK